MHLTTLDKCFQLLESGIANASK